jgi:hypothetical protein
MNFNDRRTSDGMSLQLISVVLTSSSWSTLWSSTRMEGSQCSVTSSGSSP